MTNSSDNLARQDLEAKLDRILRQSETKAPSPFEPKQADPVAADPVPELKIEPELESRKSSAKPMSVYLRAVSAPFTKASMVVQSWVVAVMKRPGRPKTEKGAGAIGKLFSKSKKLAGVRVSKPVAIFGGVLSAILAIGLTLFLNLTYMTVSAGIETTLGSSENRTVLTLKASEAKQGNLLVASLGVDEETDQEILIIGTVFSLNEQTYALYDGEVIWQITGEQIRGLVLFAEATQTP
jgi:hypothetical protein